MKRVWGPTKSSVLREILRSPNFLHMGFRQYYLSTLVRPFSICSHLLPIWNWGDFLKCYVVIVSLSVNSAVVLRVRFLQLVRLYLRVPLIWLLHCNYYTHHHDPFLIWNCSRFLSLKSFSVLCMLKLKDANSMTPYNNALAKSICTH